MLPLIFISLLATAYGFECPDVEAMAVNDTVSAYQIIQGVWYQHGRYPNSIEKQQKCLSFDTNSTLAKIAARSKDVSINATFTNEEKGTINITMISEVEQISLSTIIKFLTCDDTYLVTYGCKYNKNTNALQEVAWICTRKPQPTNETIVKINNFIATNKALDYNKFIWIDNSECGY